jgi:hypothetical protein
MKMAAVMFGETLDNLSVRQNSFPKVEVVE